MEHYHQVPVYRRFTYQSLFILGHSYVSIFLPFCAAGDFLWGFLVAKTAPVCSILQAHIYFFLCLSDLSQFLFINDLLSKGWLLYKTGSVPTSIALITGVEKKVHISAAQQRKRKVSFLIINSASRKTLGFLSEAYK